MDRFEKKLFALSDKQYTVPDTNDFLYELHHTIRRRQTVKRALLSSVSVIVITVGLTVGLYWNSSSIRYEDDVDFLLFTTVENEGLIEDEWNVEDDFVYEVLEYLVDETGIYDFDDTMIEDMESFGVLEITEPNKLEDQS